VNPELEKLLKSLLARDEADTH